MLSEELNSDGKVAMTTKSCDPLLRHAHPRGLSVLLLCDDRRRNADTVLDHIAALRQFSCHEVRTFNPFSLTNSKWLDLGEFDVVVIHYSVFVVSDHHLSPAFREMLRRFQGLKIQFIQDEHCRVDGMVTMIRFLGVHLLFTLLPIHEIPKLYGDDRLPGIVKIHTLAGYVPQHLAGVQVPPTDLRPIDVGYRGRKLPMWLGRLAQEKVWIGQGVLARAEKYKLCCDIKWAEEDRIYGRRWNRFLSSCKATLGTESGASIADFDGSIEKRTINYLADHPDHDFHQVSRALLKPHEGNVQFNTISPRIFESAALRTALILFPGDYSGIVHPWVHYLPLAKDFSNMEEIVEKLRDKTFMQAMTETAHGDLVGSGRYSYRSFVRKFDAVVAQYGSPHGRGRKVRYQLSRIERPVAVAAKRVGGVCLFAVTLLKGCIALRLMVSTYGGRKILFHYLMDGECRRGSRPGQLLQDILKLAIVGMAQAGKLPASCRFFVSLRFDRDKGHLLFVSRPGNQLDFHAFEEVSNMRHGPAQEVWWPELEAAVRNGRLRTMVWNHSALGGRVHYPLTLFKDLSVGVGKYDLHHFEVLAWLAQRLPGPTWDLLSSVLRPRRSS